MVARWNEVLGATDEVWHLGDFAVGLPRARVEALLASLHGVKHLVTGNNDPEATMVATGWASVQPYAELVEDEMQLILCHYAFRTWRDMGHGSWNLHGHSHGRLAPQPRQQDVGVDVFDFRPVTLAQLVAHRRTRRRASSRSKRTGKLTNP
jgi:calcineurin-like phosphoesterase family protein